MVTALAREELQRAALGRPTALTIGIFDGVHRGHQAVIQHVIATARAHDLAAGAITFHPHPREVLRRDLTIEYVTSLEDRLALLLDIGLDTVATVSFTSEFAQTDAGAFVRMLVEELQLKRLIIGEDFALGRQRGGDAATLTRLGEELGFAVDVIELVPDNGERSEQSTTRRRSPPAKSAPPSATVTSTASAPCSADASPSTGPSCLASSADARSASPPPTSPSAPIGPSPAPASTRPSPTCPAACGPP